jgi:HD superfamily phosphohydrolase
MAEKIIRDPVHDVIAFRTDRPAEALLFRLINAAEFQRLRRIRQLGMASLTYPGADHSRYSHSLGVMQTARRMLEQLGRSIPIDEGERTLCLAACLLHDLGHGPFSHVFERVSGMSHEGLTRRIILDETSDVHRLLSEYDAAMPLRVVELLQGRGVRAFFCDILASQLDADRFDYLLRDNLMTGSRYGGFDLNWLLHALAVHEPSGKLAVTWKGVSAAEAYLQSRYHMYRNVYFHKVVRSAEGMVKLALQRAKRLAVQERLDWPPAESVVHKALMGRRFSIEEFTDLDDISVLHCFKVWQASDDPVLAGLCGGLLFRRVFKTVDVTHLPADEAKEALAAAGDAVAAAGGDPAYDVFYDEPSETPYEAGDTSCTGDGQILVLAPTDAPVEFDAVSPMAKMLNQQLEFRRLHVAEPYRSAVEQTVKVVRPWRKRPRT